MSWNCTSARSRGYGCRASGHTCGRQRGARAAAARMSLLVLLPLLLPLPASTIPAARRPGTHSPGSTIAAVSKPGTHPPIVDPAWSPTWQFSFHPVAPHIGVQGDSCGGLIVNGTYHFMTSCGGGWCLARVATPPMAAFTSRGGHATGCHSPSAAMTSRNRREKTAARSNPITPLQ